MTPRPVAAPRPPARCLVVDDSRTIRLMMRRVLEARGCEVAEAGCGLEALAACRDVMPGGIVLDWTMPRMGGLEFLHALRAEFARELPPVVFCTARADPASRVAALAAGACEYLVKPCDPPAVVAALSRAGVL